MELGIGNASGFTSTYSQTGGLANVYGLWMGATQALGPQPGNCVISVTGGTLNLGAGGIVSGGSGTTSVTLGNATIGATAPWTASVPITLNNGTTATFNTSGGSIVLAGNLSGSGGLTATGGGTLVLVATDNYTGPTTVSSGALVVNGHVTASPIAVDATGMLEGTGSLAGATVFSGGTLAPGFFTGGGTLAPGIMTSSGSLTLVQGAALDYALGAQTRLGRAAWFR